MSPASQKPTAQPLRIAVWVPNELVDKNTFSRAEVSR